MVSLFFVIFEISHLPMILAVSGAEPISRESVANGKTSGDDKR